MINSLVWFHSIKSIALYSTIGPKYIPVFIVLRSGFDLVHLGNSPDHWVMALVDVDEQPSILVNGLFPPFFVN